MREKISRILMWASGVLITLATLMFLIHSYGAEHFVDAASDSFPPLSESLNPDAREFTVAVASDTGANNHVLEKVLINAVKAPTRPEFVMYLGDMVSRRSRTAMYWMMYEIRPKLKDVPFYATAGNHDIHHQRADRVSDKTIYRSVLGPAQYWFGYGDVLFIVLDTSADHLSDEQLQWLDDKLRIVRPSFRRCVIFTHRPPFDVRPDLLTDHAMTPADAKKFEHIIKKYNKKIDAMIFGHVHYWAADKFAGVPIYTIPSSGQAPRGDDKRYGYATLTFDKHGLKSVAPVYIDFRGDKCESVEFWFTRYIFSHAFRPITTGLVSLALWCFIVAFILRRRKK